MKFPIGFSFPMFISLAILLIGIGLFAFYLHPHINQTAAIACLVAGILGLLLTLLIRKYKKPGFTKRQTWMVFGLALVLCVGSLLYHDDYSGGEYIWHIHHGFPYSWYEAGFYYGDAVQKGISITDYVSSHPEIIQWNLDGKAAIPDALFWINIGVIGTSAFNLIKNDRHRK